MLPSFIIVGAQKCGTTSLYRYLQNHPHIRLSRQKEVHYFDRETNYPDHEWYRQQFSPRWWDWRKRSAQITGEATPVYCFMPEAIQRIHAYQPQTQLILMLRNPIDRAISHYWMNRNINREPFSLQEAFIQEEARLAESPLFRRRYSYLARGRYHEQISCIRQYFPAEQLHILRLEDLSQTPNETMRGVTDYLGVKSLRGDFSQKHWAGKYPPADDATRAWLQEYFRLHNEHLTQDFGIVTGDWV